MNEPLRPSTLGEILDRTANLYRSRFLVFFGLAAVPAAVVLGFGGGFVLLLAWAGTLGPSGAVFIGLGALLLTGLALPLMIGANALSGAALCHAAATITMGGAIAIRPAFKAVWKRGWRYVGIYLLQMLIIFAAPVAVWVVVASLQAVIAVAGTAAGGAAVGAFMGLLMILALVGLAVYVVWMLLKLCLAFPIAVIEQTGVGAALKRAWNLSCGTCWRMLVLFLLGMAVTWIATFMVLIPVILVMALVPALNSPQHAQMIGTIVVILYYAASFAVQALTWPIYAIALVLFYYDQRIRKEGFDIELLMQQAGMISEPAPQPEPAHWLPAPQQAAPAAAQSRAEEAMSAITEVVATGEPAAAMGPAAAMEPDGSADGGAAPSEVMGQGDHA